MSSLLGMRQIFRIFRFLRKIAILRVMCIRIILRILLHPERFQVILVDGMIAFGCDRFAMVAFYAAWNQNR